MGPPEEFGGPEGPPDDIAPVGFAPVVDILSHAGQVVTVFAAVTVSVIASKSSQDAEDCATAPAASARSATNEFSVRMAKDDTRITVMLVEVSEGNARAN